MKLKLLDINEVTLETKDKLCKENISLVVDNTNITPENIKSGISILGVNGTLQGGGSTESTETCTLNIKTDYQWYCGVFYQGIDGWNITGGENYNISAICGSTVTVYQVGFYKAEISAGIILAEQSSLGFVYQVPNTPNETITINIITD